MVQPVGRLQAPGTEGQQAHAGDAIGQRVHLDHVTRQDEHAEHDGCEPDDPGEAIRAHPFSKKRLTLSAPTVVGQMVSMPSSSYRSARAGSYIPQITFLAPNSC